jgi:hypothetical protein
MRFRIFFLICSLFALWNERTLLAKQWPIDAPKGATVVVKIPIHFWKSEDASFSTGTPIYTVDSDAVLGSSQWETTGLPYFGDFVVTKVFEFRPLYKLRYTDVELRSDTAWVKLRFQPGADLRAGFNALTFKGKWDTFEASDYYKTTVFGVGKAIFTGQLSNIPDSSKLALLRIAGKGLATLSSETYKDKAYIGFSLPLSGTVYNTVKLNESARVATVVNSRLTLLKSLAVIAGDAGLEGVKITEKIFYRSFVSETVAKSDTLELYAPLKVIKSFADADITNQQFIDQCIAILNSNRVQVSLSNGG